MARPGRRSKSTASRHRSGPSSRSVAGGMAAGGAWSLSSRARRRARPLLFKHSGAGTSTAFKKSHRHGKRIKKPPRTRKGGKGYNKARARGAPRNKR